MIVMAKLILPIGLFVLIGSIIAAYVVDGSRI